MLSRIAFILALAAVVVSGYALHTAREQTARSAAHITRDSAVDPAMAPEWENPMSPWKLAAHRCDPTARQLLDTWRVVAQDSHSEDYWNARFAAETKQCDKPKVYYAAG